MRQLVIDFFLLTICLFSIQCNKSETYPGLDSIRVVLVVLDASDNEVNEFVFPETDFRLMVKAINESDSEITLENYGPCPFFRDENFLAVFNAENDELVGQPLPDAAACATLNYNLSIPAYGYTYIAGSRWLDNPDNSILPLGKYYSNSTINLKGGTTIYTQTLR
jgi:hypothetical protein